MSSLRLPFTVWDWDRMQTVNRLPEYGSLIYNLSIPFSRILNWVNGTPDETVPHKATRCCLPDGSGKCCKQVCFFSGYFAVILPLLPPSRQPSQPLSFCLCPCGFSSLRQDALSFHRAAADCNPPVLSSPSRLHRLCESRA